MSAKYENDLAAASQRFAAVLRTVPVAETTKAGLHDRKLLFRRHGRVFWTNTFGAHWRHHIGRAANHTGSMTAANLGDPYIADGNEAIWKRH